MNTIVATTPEQMLAAKPVVLGWVLDRIAKAEADWADAEVLKTELVAAGVEPKRAVSIQNRAQRRVRFYEKVRAALDAGYVIIPPFDIQLFAIRTSKPQPKSEFGDHRWPSVQSAPTLPVGEGQWVDPQPDREESHQVKRKNGAGNEYEVTIYQNGPWKDLTIPVRAMQPQLIRATSKALQEKIFDAIGIAPAFRSADPIIAGQLRSPEGKTLTFFVAWWLDERDLP